MGIFRKGKTSGRRYHSGLVLAGGAARGAYQIGAWETLRKHGFRFDGFTGTSVGALNATLMAQGDWDFAVELWSNLGIQDVLTLPDFLQGEDISKLSWRKTVALLQEVRRSGGLDSSPLLNMLRTRSKEEKLRKSGVDLGVVTFGVSKFRPLKIFLDEMEPGSLPDYLYASASFPLFKMAKIEDKRFTDGGVWDNLPWSMLTERGYRDLVIIDISAYGMVRRPDPENRRILYIKNSLPLPHLMDFSRKSLDYSRKLGRLDSMRILGDVGGLEYYIDPSKDSKNRLGRIEDNGRVIISQDLPDNLKKIRSGGLAVFEAAAKAYGIPRAEYYSVDTLFREIREKDRKLVQGIRNGREEGGLNPGTIRDILFDIAKQKMGDHERLSENPPILWLMGGKILLPKQSGYIKSMLKVLYPELETALQFRQLFDFPELNAES